MNEELRSRFCIPADHQMVQVEVRKEQKKGQNTDTHWYDQIDPDGKLVARFVEVDSTSIYPPFGRYISYERIPAKASAWGGVDTAPQSARSVGQRV